MSSHSMRSRRRSRQQFNQKFLLILTGTTALIIAAIVLLTWLNNRPPIPAAASAAESSAVDETNLLPLAEPVAPINGFHDMNNLPNAPVPTRAVAASVPQANLDLPVIGWDWGTIPSRPPVRQTFPIQNTGDEPLLISSVVTSCGCTTADLSSSLIPPGQRADLAVTFDPNFHETSGPVTRLVWLETNDPDTPFVELRLDANVLP